MNEGSVEHLNNRREDTEEQTGLLILRLRLGRFLNRYLTVSGPPPYGLSDEEAATLALIAVATDRGLWLDRRTIAEKLDVEKKRTAHLLSQLKRRGLCKAVGPPEPKQTTCFHITAEGARALLKWIGWWIGPAELAELPTDPEVRRRENARLREQLAFLMENVTERIQKSPHGEERRRAPQVAVASSASRRTEDAVEPTEIVKRGREIYERRWKELLEQTARGKYVAINLETEEYVIGNTVRETYEAFRARFPAPTPGNIIEIPSSA